MIERYYDQWKLSYCLKFFKWRLKFKEMYSGQTQQQISLNLFQMLSIDKRQNQIENGKKMIMEAEVSDDEDEKKENNDPPEQIKQSPADSSPIRRNRTESIKKMTKKQSVKKSKFKNKNQDQKLEEEGIQLMNELRFMEYMDNELLRPLPEEGFSSAMARAYLSFPPQMKFVPTEQELEKLILNATKYRYVKDIPKIT